eukprot:CAMPEP_0117513080 /NCGR_PEP_ID=MMETSP0784-20121206/29364_1 /TAXON_ID=39447 /ORGANISM="" /LENGTH=372 /DNA_ID=CAMNT_0005308823 /DNA_START=62 /DNA_END=1176 /DNA_ORIENTATION=-
MRHRLLRVTDHVQQGFRTFTAHVAPWSISSKVHAKLPVLVNSKVLCGLRDNDNLQLGVPSGRIGNNNPESRRNRMVHALKCVAGAELTPTEASSDLADAELSHSAGFVHFLKTAFQRWETELVRDASYVMPQRQEHADVALVPFHCVKSELPRSRGLSAEFACYASDFETPIFESTAQVLMEDLGIVATAADRISRGDRAVYALTTHPGHHAGPSCFSGFCYVNNASVACALLEKSGRRPALLDLDFHAGDGSYDIARAHGRWFRSIHCANSYPWVDMGTMGIELTPGTNWADGYASALEKVLAEVPKDTDTLVVSLGYDTLSTDPEAGKRAGVGLSLLVPDFYAMAAVLARQGLPILVVQEGGYDLERVPL